MMPNRRWCRWWSTAQMQDAAPFPTRQLFVLGMSIRKDKGRGEVQMLMVVMQLQPYVEFANQLLSCRSSLTYTTWCFLST